VESTNAKESRCNEIALEPNRQTEPLVTVPQLLERSHENNVSTRDRLAGTGADARIEESVAMGKCVLRSDPMEGKINRFSAMSDTSKSSPSSHHPAPPVKIRVDADYLKSCGSVAGDPV
jgi:hypothetical protein